MAHTLAFSSMLQTADFFSRSCRQSKDDCTVTQVFVLNRSTARVCRHANVLRRLGAWVCLRETFPLIQKGSVSIFNCSNALLQQSATPSTKHQNASNHVVLELERSAANIRIKCYEDTSIHSQNRAVLGSAGREESWDAKRGSDAVERVRRNDASKSNLPFVLQVVAPSNSTLDQTRPTTSSIDLPAPDSKAAAFLSSKKECLHCGYIKSLRDFPKLSSSTDGRHEVCRGCMAAFKAIRLQKELHHLGMTVAEAWEQSKACARCGEVKELRDYSVLRRNPDGLQTQCRSCESEMMSSRPRKKPTDASQVCGACNVRKPASAFGTHRSNANGLNKACRTCRVEREMVRRERKATLFISRTQKLCLKCNTNKAPEEFAKSTLSNDGLTPDCKQCKRSRMREHRERTKLQSVAEGS